ncbi:MAG: transposase [Pseudomonadota bacterium]
MKLLWPIKVFAGAGHGDRGATRHVGTKQQTYYRWRKMNGGMGDAQLKRLKELEKEIQHPILSSQWTQGR